MSDNPTTEQFTWYGHPGDVRECWRAYCPDCIWSSRDLPFPTEAKALHMLDLHKTLCEGAKT